MYYRSEYFTGVTKDAFIDAYGNRAGNKTGYIKGTYGSTVEITLKDEGGSYLLGYYSYIFDNDFENK